MPLTAEQSYALGTPAGRDRINQQLRANPQYIAYLRSIGVNTDGPWRLSDQQRKLAQSWVTQQMGSIGGLEIDPSGNLNNPHGFGTELKQWGLPVAAAAGIAAPFVLPALGIGGGASAPAAANAAFDALPAISSAEGAANAASLGWTLPATGGAGGGLGTAATAAAAGGGMADRLKKLLTSPEGIGVAASIAAALASKGNSSNDQYDALQNQAARNAAITEARMRRVDPLHEAAVQLAFSRLPVSSRQGINLTRVPLPE